MNCIIVFVVLLLATASANNFRQARAMRRPDFEGRLKDTNILFKVRDCATVTSCNLHCLADIRCVSYYYLRTERLCQLHSVVFYSQKDILFSSETYYYQLYEDWCPPEDKYNLYRQEDTCYKQTGRSYPYDQAVSYCQGKSETLLKIKTEEKNNHMKSFLADEQKGTSIWDQFYIAARNDTGTLIWSDGDPVNFTDFPVGEPSSDTEHCLTLHQIFAFRWNDMACNLNCKIICEKFKP